MSGRLKLCAEKKSLCAVAMRSSFLREREFFVAETASRTRVARAPHVTAADEQVCACWVWGVGCSLRCEKRKKTAVFCQKNVLIYRCQRAFYCIWSQEAIQSWDEEVQVHSSTFFILQQSTTATAGWVQRHTLIKKTQPAATSFTSLINKVINQSNRSWRSLWRKEQGRGRTAQADIWREKRKYGKQKCQWNKSTNNSICKVNLLMAQCKLSAKTIELNLAHPQIWWLEAQVQKLSSLGKNAGNIAHWGERCNQQPGEVALFTARNEEPGKRGSGWCMELSEWHCERMSGKCSEMVLA